MEAGVQAMVGKAWLTTWLSVDEVLPANVLPLPGVYTAVSGCVPASSSTFESMACAPLSR